MHLLHGVDEVTVMTPKFIPSLTSKFCQEVKTTWEDIISTEICISHEPLLEKRRGTAEDVGKEVKSFIGKKQQQNKQFFKVLLYRFPEKKLLHVFFFYPDFLIRTFRNHWIAGEGGGHFFNSSLPLPPASQTLRH